MNTSQKINKLTNQIDSESRQLSPNFAKIDKWEKQMDKLFTKIENSVVLQEQYEFENGCEWDG